MSKSQPGVIPIVNADNASKQALRGQKLWDFSFPSGRSWKSFRCRLEDLFPSRREDQDRLLIVLKGNLVLEKMTLSFIASRLPNPEALKKANLNTSQRIALAESMCLNDEEPRWLWTMVSELNSKRNKLAHSLELRDLEQRLDKLTSKAQRSKGYMIHPSPESSRAFTAW